MLVFHWVAWATTFLSSRELRQAVGSGSAETCGSPGENKKNPQKNIIIIIFLKKHIKKTTNKRDKIDVTGYASCNS